VTRSRTYATLVTLVISLFLLEGCQDKCGFQQTLCGEPGVCSNLTSDPQNCGACGTKCKTGMACVAGVCRCPKQWDRYVGANCVDLLSDNNNCGEIGKRCNVKGGELCVWAVCTPVDGGLPCCDPDKGVTPQPDKGVTPDKAKPTPDKAAPTPDKAAPTPDKAAPTPDKAATSG
jgi:hypothetical protein